MGTGTFRGTIDEVYDYRPDGEEEVSILVDGRTMRVPVLRVAYERQLIVQGQQQLPPLRLGSIERANPMDGLYERTERSVGTLRIHKDATNPMILGRDTNDTFLLQMPQVPLQKREDHRVWTVTNIRS